MTHIRPRNNNGGIVLRFTYKGEQYNLNPVPRGKFTDKLALSKAGEIALRIEQDMIAGYFDPTLAKYKSVSGGSKATKSALQTAKKDLMDNAVLSALFDDYTTFKSKTLKSNSLIDYRLIKNKLRRCHHKRVHEAVDIVRWLVNDHKGSSSSSLEKQLKLINACCKWGVAGKLLESNPFEGLRSLLPVTKSSGNGDDINPFTLHERDIIIRAFKVDATYHYYAPLVEFLFLTGCRPEEALALQWKHVKGASITFCQKLTANGEIEPGTKTQNKRSITVNARTEQLLFSIKKENALPDDLVFPAKKGGLADWHNFANRAWRRVLASLDDIEYRNPYQMRHTAITQMVRSGVDSTVVARWVGNSPNIISKRYLGSVSDIAIPE